MKCHFCGSEIRDERGSYRRVVGWEKPGRGASGISGSSLVLRETTHELACPECIVRLQRGLNVAQESLV